MGDDVVVVKTKQNDEEKKHIIIKYNKRVLNLVRVLTGGTTYDDGYLYVV